MRWIWIDRFAEFTPHRSAVAVKQVSWAEDHLHDQYPEYPLYPHAFMLEGVAQAGGILVGHANDFRELVVLAKIPSVTFLGTARPGDTLEYAVTLTELRPEGAIVDGRVRCNGRELGAVEVVFAHLDPAVARAAGLGDENFVFQKDHLLALLKTAPPVDTVGNRPDAPADPQ